MSYIKVDVCLILHIGRRFAVSIEIPQAHIVRDKLDLMTVSVPERRLDLVWIQNQFLLLCM